MVGLCETQQAQNGNAADLISDAIRQTGKCVLTIMPNGVPLEVRVNTQLHNSSQHKLCSIHLRLAVISTRKLRAPRGNELGT